MIFRVNQRGYSDNPRRNFSKEFKPLARHRRLEGGKASNTSARTGETLGKALCNWIGLYRKDDWYRGASFNSAEIEDELELTTTSGVSATSSLTEIRLRSGSNPTDCAWNRRAMKCGR